MPLRLSRKALTISRDALRALSPVSRRGTLSPSRRGARCVSRAAAACAACETLESRQLLTAIINGLFQGSGTIYDGGTVFEYLQADNTIVRISVFGNVTAEFIGARTPDASFDVITRDLVPATDTGDGVDLFSIYVAQADINSVISIAVVPGLNTPARFMMPFEGSAGSVSIFNAQTGVIEQADTGPGGVYMGVRTHDFMNQDLNDQPIITPPDGRRRFGLRPSSAGQMFSGLECAAGVNLGKFMLGGTITGLVDIPGSIRLFYAGTILTGDAIGLPETASSSINNNFFVGGDIEHLVTATSFGTAPTLDQQNLEDIVYKTGFDLQVNGRVGWIRAVDSFLGSTRIRNHPSVRGLGIAQEELEFSGEPLNPLSDESYFDPTFFGDNASLGTKTRNSTFDNDTFDTAQHLGTLFSTDLNSREAIQVRGFTWPLRGDGADYYAVSLLAGQTAQVQMLNAQSLTVGVFDPDGRLIATNYSNVSPTGRIFKPFRFTADRPGPYRIAVAPFGDSNFNEVLDAGEDGHSSVSPDFYELRIQRVADIALGGLIANFHIATYDAGGDGITVERGDVGAIRAGIPGLGTIFSVSNPWSIQRGNLRSVQATSMGILRDTPVLTFVGQGPDFLVPRGSIGLLQTTGTNPTQTMMFVNQALQVQPGLDLIDDDLTSIPAALAAGVDIQLVDCASNLQSNLLANRSIGVIRAAQVSAILGNSPGAWVVNVDQRGEDGRIDLIDVQNFFGELGPGGPAIATGPGGNVRYMRVGGEMFRDRFFGGGTGNETNFQPDERVTLTDDNGTEFTMRSTPRPQNVDPVTGFPTTGINAPGRLSALTYPVRDKAGSILIRVTAHPGTSALGADVGRGVEVVSQSRGSGGSIELGEVIVESPGTNLAFDQFTRVVAPIDPPAARQNSDVVLSGTSPIDVWSIIVRAPGGGDFTGSTNIANGTSGEIVNVRAAHIAGISANTIGLAKSSTGAAVNGVNVLINGYPYSQQRNLIAAQAGGGPGHIGSLRARQGIGNVFAAGSIASIAANADSRNARGVFEGINGPIVAAHNGGQSAISGNIVSVSIGEGIGSSGSGNVAFAGLYAEGQIDRVRGGGAGNDIHGDIISRGDTPGVQTRTVNGVVQTTPNFFIGDIILTNGAIIDADIMTVDTFEDSREFDRLIVIPQRANVITAPVFQIRSIQINGIGGIIGSNIAADDLGLISINGGFGVISSFINSLGDSVIDGIITDGYGIRSTTIEGGADLNRLIARGTGKRLDTRSYTSSVRNSERGSFDPFTGNSLDGSNDLHKYLGTTRSAPKRKGLSDSGVIEDTLANGQRTLGQVDAHRIIARNVIVISPTTGRKTRIPFGAVSYPMRFSFGQGVQSIRVRDIVDGLALTGGGIGTFSTAGDVLNTAVNVTGRIQNLSAGALRGSTSIKARGSQGGIDNITTKRSLFASIESTLDIGTIKVGTDLGSPNVSTSRNLNLLSVNGSILTGASVRVARVLGTLDVGRDVQAGATIRADEITNQEIGGQVLGDIIIT